MKSLRLLTFLLVLSSSYLSAFPMYPIGMVTTTDVNGRCDSNNVHCQISGVVYGVNVRPYGLQFTMNDHTGGIIVYSGGRTYGYTVNEGDSVVVSGIIAQFRGAIQIATLDTVYKVGTATIQQPMVVTALSKATESWLVRINNLTLSGAWTPAGRGFNVSATDGTTTFTLRIDSMTTAYTMTPPTGTFDVIGLGSIYTTDSVHSTTGWELHPRYMQDFIEHTTNIAEVSSSLEAVVYPNPNNGSFVIQFKDNLNLKDAEVKLYDISGRLVYASKENISASTSIETNNLNAGIYLVEVRAAEKIYRTKVAVQK